MSKITVTGKVVEKSSNQPLEYATIIFNSVKSGKQFGGLTNGKGQFEIEIPKGFYNIRIEFISFKTITLENKDLTEDTNLGTIALQDDNETLDEVELIAEKSTVDIRLDKKIYNIGKDMTVKGGTASDVLDNVPSVTVDQEGAVSLRGNDNVTVLINGKPSSLVGLSDTEALKQFPADAIEKVEVITSPSARYDASGTGGIINIIIRKGKALGFNGSATLNAGYPTNYGASANINYRTKNFNLFNNTGYSYSDGPGNAKFDTEYLNPKYPSISYNNEKRDFDRQRKNFNINFGMEYYLTKNSSLTGSVFYRDSKRGNDAENSSIILADDFSVSKDFLRLSTQDSNRENWQYSLNYQNELNDKGQKLTLDFQYQDNYSDEFSNVDEEIIYINEDIDIPGFDDEIDEKSDQFETSKEILLQGDYVLPLGENQQFELGFRSTLKDEETDYTLFFKDPNTGDFIRNDSISNIFYYDENIHAVYTQYGNKFGKFSALVGLRMEITDIDIAVEEFNDDFDVDDAKKDYTDFFPTANISYEFSEAENITLGYNRRIRRPWSRFINPFPSRQSKTVIFQGNPYLDPSISDAMDLGYYKRWKKITLNTSIYFNHATDVFEFISEETGESTDDGIPVIRRTAINLSNTDRFGTEFSLNYTPKRGWRFNGSFNLFKSVTEGFYEGTDFGAENLSWFARLGSKVVLPAKIDWQTTAMYMGPSENAQSKREGVFMMNMAFSKDILDGDGTISFNVSDLFNSRKRVQETFTASFYQDSEFQYRQRQFRLAFTYRFKQAKKRERQRNFEGEGGEETF